jgi:hypothetical protein
VPLRARKGRRRDQDVDFLGSQPVILDDIAVGAQIERAKQRAPPLRRDVACEIAERTGRADVPFSISAAGQKAIRA